jgi:hypothetical protein
MKAHAISHLDPALLSLNSINLYSVFILPLPIVDDG